METKERETTLRDYLDTIVKRKAIILVSVLVVTLSGAIFAPKDTAVYKATARVIVEGSPYEINLIEFIRRFIRSYGLAEEAARAIRLDKAESMKTGGELGKWAVFDISINELQKSIISEHEEESDIIGISALADHPEKAQYIANMVAKVVVEQSFKGITSGTQASLKYVEKQIDTLKNKIEEAKEVLSRYSSVSTSKSDISSEEAVEFDRLQQDYVKARLERQMAEARLEVLEEKLAARKSDDALISIMPQSRHFLDLKDKFSSLERERDELLVRFTEEHPSVIAIQEKIKEAGQDIDREIKKPLEELKIQIAGAKNKEDTLKKILESRFPVIPDDQFAEKESDSLTPQLMRELRLHEKTYENLLNEREKLRVEILLDATRVRVLSFAVEPRNPEKPKGPPAILITASLGLILGLTAAFMQENMDTSFKTVEELEYYTQLPLVGVIPLIKGGKGGRKSVKNPG